MTGDSGEQETGTRKTGWSGFGGEKNPSVGMKGLQMTTSWALTLLLAVQAFIKLKREKWTENNVLFCIMCTRTSKVKKKTKNNNSRMEWKVREM